MHVRCLEILAIACLALAGCSTGSTTSGAVQKLSADEFLGNYAREDSALLLDCRTWDEYAAGSLPGARVIDFKSDTFVETARQIGRDLPVYIYCRSGGRSARAASVLRELGVREVYDLEGGYEGLQLD